MLDALTLTEAVNRFCHYFVPSFALHQRLVFAVNIGFSRESVRGKGHRTITKQIQIYHLLIER
jgi:hypothetical protein